MQIKFLLIPFFFFVAIVYQATFREGQNSILRGPAANTPATLTCRPNIVGCRTNVDCCSFNCSQNVCQRSLRQKGIIGMPCLLNNDCHSNFCGPEKLCRGSISNGIKAAVGQYCSGLSQECFSNYCDSKLKKCRGNINSSVLKAYVGQFCRLDAECRSGFCYKSPGFFCLGSPSDPAQYLEPCNGPNQCGEGLFCDYNVNFCRPN